MSRRLLTAATAVGSLCLALAACGGSNDTAREDYGFKGSTTNGVPYVLTINTGGVDTADTKATLTDAKGHKTQPLGKARGCASPANHDDMFRVKFTLEATNREAGDPKLKIVLGIEDGSKDLLDTSDSDVVSIAWLSKGSAECETTSDGSFADTVLSKANNYEVQGFVILPGGKDNYKKDFQLVVITDSGEIHDPFGGVRQYTAPNAKGVVGVKANLVP